MGRNLKRVPLDFAWPLKKTWDGYINPFDKLRQECGPCYATGYGPEAKRYHDEWYGHVAFDAVAYGSRPLAPDHPSIIEFARRNIERSPDYYCGTTTPTFEECIAAEVCEAIRLFQIWRLMWAHQLAQVDVDALVDADHLCDFTRVPRTDEQRSIVAAKIAAGGNSWLPESNGYRPTADEVNAWSMLTMGSGSTSYICIKARCEREGAPLLCSTCNGHGSWWPSSEAKEQHDAWKPTEPPTGDGYQLWQDTGKGSPVSPVFATLDELCDYAADHCTVFADMKADAAEWRRMLDDGLVTAQLEDEEGNTLIVM